MAPATDVGRPGACADANVELTYAHVGRRLEAPARQFAAVSVGRGDVLAIMLPNRVELLIELIAA